MTALPPLRHQIVSQSLDLDTLLNTGIGKNINIIL